MDCYRERGSQIGYLTHGNSKGEAKGRNRHKNNARVVRILEELERGTKGKSPKQGLTNVKNLTIYLPYHKLD